MWISDNKIELEDGTVYELEHFTKHENWGKAEEINPQLLVELDKMREYAGVPFIVHYGTQGSHSPNSQHYHGNAVDGHFEGLSWMEQLLIATRFGFTGIGVYPFWNNPGIHVDVRENVNYRAMWWRDRQGSYHSIEEGLDNVRTSV